MAHFQPSTKAVFFNPPPQVYLTCESGHSLGARIRQKSQIFRSEHQKEKKTTLGDPRYSPQGPLWLNSLSAWQVVAGSQGRRKGDDSEVLCLNHQNAAGNGYYKPFKIFWVLFRMVTHGERALTKADGRHQ